MSWAQRSNASTAAKNIIYLTVFAPDVPDAKLKVDLQPSSVEVTGESTTKGTTYHVKMDFFEEIDVDESKTFHTARDVAFVLRKKEMKEEYWPRLTKEKAKLHFLKTDFDKWVDEDEQDGVADEDPMAGMGGMGGMPGMGGEDGGFGGIDFSKLGGAGGMPDLSGMGGMEGLGGMGGAGGDDESVSRVLSYKDDF